MNYRKCCKTSKTIQFCEFTIKHTTTTYFLRHPSMDMHQKKKSSTLLQNQSYHLKHKDYNQKNTNPFNAFKSKLNRKINQSY